MALENSPSLDEFENGIPAKLSDPSARKKRIRSMGLLLLVLLFILFGIGFAQSDASALLSGKGSVSGMAINAQGNPFQGNVYILGTNLESQTNPDGTFKIEGIPAGTRSLVLANEYAGYEFPVVVLAGEDVAIGQIQFMTTATP